MICESLYIEQYDWTVYCFFDVRSVDEAESILSLLQTLGITKRLYEEVEEYFERASLDTGFTYTKSYQCESVMVVGSASSVGEAFNTFSHELRHLVDDIAKEYSIPKTGERVAYLTGDIAMALFSGIEHVVCKCPKCKDRLNRRQLH